MFQPFFKTTGITLITICTGLCIFSFMTTYAIASGNDSDTLLLIQSDTVDGDTAFADTSIGGTAIHTITPYGVIQHTTDNAKFGNSSIFFDGSDDYLEISTSDDFVFGTNDFTIDFWVKPLSLTPSTRQYLASSVYTSSNSASDLWNLFLDPDGQLYFGNSYLSLQFGLFPDTVDFHHVAVTREGNTFRAFMDGVLVHTVNTPSNNYSGAPVRLGKCGTYPIHLFSGHMDEFRISGVARWADNFTPPNTPYGQTALPLEISTLSADPVSGKAPLDVGFSSTITGGTAPYAYAWDFGDGETSTEQNPSHVYTAPGAYSVQITVTDADGNTANDSVAVSVQSSVGCASHAVFDPSSNILTIPFLDVPLIDPISQQEIPDQHGVFSCTMKYVSNSGGSFSFKDITYLPNETGDDCHATFSYDGTVYIPNVDVVTVIALPWNNIVEGPVQTYAVTLKQLMLNPSYFHLENAVNTSQP